VAWPPPIGWRTLNPNPRIADFIALQEHHLQAALFASSQRTLSTTQIKPTVASDATAYIPTPDAAGLVADYDNLYPPTKYKDPATHLRFSDSLDETCASGLTGSFTYFLDERDAEWLERNNGAARGEGTSTGATANGTNGVNGVVPPRTPHARSAKARGKEPEHAPPNVAQQPSMVIDEDQFELIMGLFEKWTDETVSPYLHLVRIPCMHYTRVPHRVAGTRSRTFPSVRQLLQLFGLSSPPVYIRKLCSPI